jgi:nicotinate-nucleotide adenylyltransferase
MTIKKIGFYGGSFDPIHLGHLNLMIELKERCQLDEVWVCPTHLSPFKKESVPAAPEHRFEMIKLAVSDLPYIKVLDIEILKKDISYTYDTLQELTKEHAKKNDPILLHLMIGDDCLADLASWKNIEKLLHEFPLLIGRRLRHPPDPHSLFSETMSLTETSLMEISSTIIRKRLKNQFYCGHLLSERVCNYIKLHGLYK